MFIDRRNRDRLSEQRAGPASRQPAADAEQRNGCKEYY